MNQCWKIAVIGSGPAGFYAAGELFRQQSWEIKVDMFERLPTPFGLVRGGVAPDHQKIKSVQKIYSRIAENENFRFFGNVEFGRDIFQADLLEHYDAVIYSVGSPADRELGIPGEKICPEATLQLSLSRGITDIRIFVIINLICLRRTHL